MKGDKLWQEHHVNTLFPLDKAVEETEERSQGRDAELVAARNEQIIYRWHYWGTLTRKLWPEASKLLAQEFYLSEVTLYKIVQENGALRRRLINENITVKMLRDKYPLAKWD
jgi:hypothetical protein